MIAMTPVAKGNYEAIGRAAFERYLLDLMQECAVEEERLHLEVRGEPLSLEIREIKLDGEYPNTGFQFRIYDRRRNLEQTSWWPLYASSTFFDEDRKRRCEPERIVGDTLMLARGG